MSDNITIKDGNGTNITVRTTDSGGVHTPHHIVEQLHGLYEATLSLDTLEYADGDVLADTQLLDANAFAANGGQMLVQSIHIIDKDDNAGELDIVLLRSNTSIGSENSAFSISDNDSVEVVLVKQVYPSNYIDMGGFKWGKVEVGEVIKAASDSTALYIAAISRDTKTYTAAGLVVRVGVLEKSS